MNFEDKVLSLFDNGRRSVVYVAGYQSARAQAASIAAEADRLIAEMAVENAELREQLAAKDAELERVRKTLIEIRRSDTSTAGVKGVYAEMIDAAHAEPEREVEPVAAPAGYFCEPYLNKPGLFEQVFNGFDDPDVIPLYRDPNGRIAALEREVEALNTKISSVRSTLNHWNKFRPDLFAEPEFTDLMMVIFDEQEALAGGEAG